MDSILKVVQKELIPWQQHNFPGRPSWQPLLGMGEELGELNHAFLKKAQGIRGTPEEHMAKMKDAIADLLVYMCDFCNTEGIDPEQELWAAWTKVRQRDWRKHPVDADKQVEGLSRT